MKNFIKTLLIFVIAFNSACKEKEEQPASQETIKQENISKQLIINLNFKTNKADVFKIMMNNIKVDDFQKKNIQILEDVIPSTKEDYIIAEFDAGNISNNILINFGNKQPKEVEIISVSVSYGEQYFNITTLEDFNKYFTFNKYIDTNPDNKIITTKKVDGKHFPAIYLRRSFIDMLKKS